jgi:hypothetical protein
MKSLESATEYLNKVVYTQSYNNLSPLYWLANKENPEKLGNDCFGINIGVGEALKKQGYDIYYIKDQSALHVTFLLENEGELFYTDPSLLLNKFVSLNSIIQSQSCPIFQPALPYTFENGPTKYILLKIKENILETLQTRRRADGEIRSSRVFHLDLNDQNKTPPKLEDYRDDMLKYHKYFTKELTLACLKRDDSMTTIRLDIETSDWKMRQIGGTEYVRDLQESEFEKEFEIIADMKNLQVDQLQDYFLEALDIIKEIRKDM